jgi:hypothetical protein
MVRFGHINERNHDGLTAIPPFLESQEGKAVALVVQRDGEAKNLQARLVLESVARLTTCQLRPKKWSGRGLLGSVAHLTDSRALTRCRCHIVPL